MEEKDMGKLGIFLNHYSELRKHLKGNNSIDYKIKNLSNIKENDKRDLIKSNRGIKRKSDVLGQIKYINPHTNYQEYILSLLGYKSFKKIISGYIFTVYLITIKIDGQDYNYVGKTINPIMREKSHSRNIDIKKRINYKFQIALKNAKKIKFRYNVLQYFDSEKEMIKHEKYLISKIIDMPYNLNVKK